MFDKIVPNFNQGMQTFSEQETFSSSYNILVDNERHHSGLQSTRSLDTDCTIKMNQAFSSHCKEYIEKMEDGHESRSQRATEYQLQGCNTRGETRAYAAYKVLLLPGKGTEKTILSNIKPNWRYGKSSSTISNAIVFTSVKIHPAKAVLCLSTQREWTVWQIGFEIVIPNRKLQPLTILGPFQHMFPDDML